jgi:hypothetical protein
VLLERFSNRSIIGDVLSKPTSKTKVGFKLAKRSRKLKICNSGKFVF